MPQNGNNLDLYGDPLYGGEPATPRVNNTDYIYDHLPSRYRRDDKNLFLKRFLRNTGETLDAWDLDFDTFFQSIDSPTAAEKWVRFWLYALFGWSWFPWWFTLTEKRRLYGNFARHLARRGTRRGIELWLLDFGIVARVHTRTLPWQEFVWGETHFAVTSPLHILIEILFLQAAETDLQVWQEGAWGEFYYSEPRPLFTGKEIIDLIRYVQPHAQEIAIIWRAGSIVPAGA